MSKRKSDSKAKLKGVSQEERTHRCNEYFKNLLGNFPKAIDIKIINKLVDIKVGQATQEELSIV